MCDIWHKKFDLRGKTGFIFKYWLTMMPYHYMKAIVWNNKPNATLRSKWITVISFMFALSWENLFWQRTSDDISLRPPNTRSWVLSCQEFFFRGLLLKNAGLSAPWDAGCHLNAKVEGKRPSRLKQENWCRT